MQPGALNLCLSIHEAEHDMHAEGDIKGKRPSKVLPLHLQSPLPYQRMNCNECPSMHLRVIFINNGGAVEVTEVLHFHVRSPLMIRSLIRHSAAIPDKSSYEST